MGVERTSERLRHLGQLMKALTLLDLYVQNVSIVALNKLFTVLLDNSNLVGYRSKAESCETHVQRDGAEVVRGIGPLLRIA
jgi:hypothetical protein